MTEPIDELTVRTAFARLRAEESGAIRPPGVAAARRSVRRRRQVAAVATGVAALLLTTGTAAAWQLTADPAPGVTTVGQPGTPSPDAEPEPSTDPATPSGTAEPETSTGDSGDQLESHPLSRIASLVLDELVGEGAQYYTRVTGIVGGEDLAGAPSQPTPGGTKDLPTGTWRLTMVCGGQGEVVTMLILSGERIELTARCGSTYEEIAAGAASTTLELGEPLEVSFEMEGVPSDSVKATEKRIVQFALERVD